MLRRATELMDFDDSPREAAFRAEARTWLEQHADLRTEATERLTVLSGFQHDPESIRAAKAWQRTLAESGWAAITWPSALGGRDAGPLEALVWAEELNRFDLPANIFSIGIAMIGPTIIAHGTAAQQERYLRPMLEGAEVWCQLWSEPGAGSDLAGLSSRAERVGDHYVLTGQKVWTSGAHYSDFGLGLFRSDVAAPKHHGISALIVDMRSPGIDIRPLRQITGDSHFSEVFFDEVLVPVENLVGEENGGWRVGRTTMMNERFAAGAMGAALGPFRALARLAQQLGASADARTRQELAKVYTLSLLFDLTTARVRTSLARGMIPGMEGSILKLAAAHLGTALADAGCSLLGPAGLLTGAGAPEHGRWPEARLGSIAMHIGGGTDEIQRNIIGEVVLGLPREPTVSP
ncbi:MAG TPA: acyl-CoA dehydrogenase family protein [Acidimicrobiales bacterium]